MDGMGGLFLTAARRSGYQDGIIIGADPAYELKGLLHHLGNADHAAQGAAFVGLLLQPAVGRFKTMHLKGPVQNHFEHLNIDGFCAEVIGSQGHCFEGGFLFGISGNNDDLGGRGESCHLFEQFQTRIRGICRRG